MQVPFCALPSGSPVILSDRCWTRLGIDVASLPLTGQMKQECIIGDECITVLQFKRCFEIQLSPSETSIFLLKTLLSFKGGFFCLFCSNIDGGWGVYRRIFSIPLNYAWPCFNLFLKYNNARPSLPSPPKTFPVGKQIKNETPFIYPYSSPPGSPLLCNNYFSAIWFISLQ